MSWYTRLHPPTCALVERYEGCWEPDCAVAFVVNTVGHEPFDGVIFPGLRVIGWRHDVYPGGPWGGTEHDVICWALGACPS